MTPELSGEHLHRYAVAEPSCVGKRVLDLWCGTGRGSAFLARRATSVVGIDADEKTIVRARRNHYQENLQFARAAPDNLPLVGNTIDVITCFDTLERIAEPDALFEEFCRVLAPQAAQCIATKPSAMAKTQTPTICLSSRVTTSLPSCGSRRT